MTAVDPKIFSKLSAPRRYLLLLAVTAGLVVVGTLIALNVHFLLPQSKTPIEIQGKPAIISEITLSGLVAPEERTKKDPRLRQQASYQAGDPLALRITTSPDVTHEIQISVRLVTETGSILEMNPSSLTFQPGSSTFCCWTIDKPGKYTLQIFRPEKVVTGIPLTIKPASGHPEQKLHFSL